MDMLKDKKIPVIAVVGPTASGKTALAVSLAKALDGEVISADSMQIYRGMDIATAKPTADEMQGVRHHLIDFLPPTEEYSVKRFCDDALAAAKDIASRGKTVIVAGGTGLYVDALLGRLSFEEEPDHTEVRAELQARLREEGREALVKELLDADPALADEIDLQNDRRVLRALEIWRLTGEKPSVRRGRAFENDTPFDPLYLALFFRDRQLLYDRISKRVDLMLETGLIEEARAFYRDPASSTAVAAIGYKELKPYLDGQLPLVEAVENLKTATRHYAKRQLTWFGRNDTLVRLYADEPGPPPLSERALNAAREFLLKRRLADA